MDKITDDCIEAIFHDINTAEAGKLDPRVEALAFALAERMDFGAFVEGGIGPLLPHEIPPEAIALLARHGYKVGAG
jgi:hypothetical protein